MVDKRRLVLLVVILFRFIGGVRINFTSCHDERWTCLKNQPEDIVYTCSAAENKGLTIHLKDYYIEHITSVTVQNCPELDVVLDCPQREIPSQLQQFKVKNCARLKFVSLSASSSFHTPPELMIENVGQIDSIPRGMFTTSTPNAELKCKGTKSLRKIRIRNSRINTIFTKAIYNVSELKTIELDNVTITDIQQEAIEAVMSTENTIFKIVNSRIYNINPKSITVRAATVILTNNEMGDILSISFNITSDVLQFTGNRIQKINSNGIVLKSINTDISKNDVNIIKGHAFASVKCLRKRAERKQFNFSKNVIRKVEPNSLNFDYTSCKNSGTRVSYSQNRFDCKCRNLAHLYSPNANRDFSDSLFDTANNNTCVGAPCLLPINIVQTLLENNMCQLNLDLVVMCLFYNDRRSNNEMTTDEEVTDATPTFYLIKQANAHHGDTSAALTALNKTDLFINNSLNMTNRTTVKVVFDSSKDFVETLRSTSSSSSRRRPMEGPKSPPIRYEYVNRCVGGQCRNNIAYDKQKALDFYKYVYAQLRTPKQNNDNKIT